jgi:hypothetical protein
MITIEAINCTKADVAVPPRQQSIWTQTAYIAQFTHKLRSFYAKQTQFAECSNKRKCCYNKGLCKSRTMRTPEKQTQFQTHRLRTAQPTINMQNKPNFRKHKKNLTTCGNKDYEKCEFTNRRKNKPNFQPKWDFPPASIYTRCTLSQQTLLNNLPGLF